MSQQILHRVISDSVFYKSHRDKNVYFVGGSLIACLMSNNMIIYTLPNNE